MTAIVSPAGLSGTSACNRRSRGLAVPTTSEAASTRPAAALSGSHANLVLSTVAMTQHLRPVYRANQLKEPLFSAVDRRNDLRMPARFSSLEPQSAATSSPPFGRREGCRFAGDTPGTLRASLAASFDTW